MMEETNKTEDLEYYLSDPFNIVIYQELETHALFDPLSFFKLFYELVRLIDEGKVLSVIEKLNKIGFMDGLKLFIVYHLLQKYRSVLPGIALSVERPPALFLLEQEYQRLESCLPMKHAAFLFINSESADERAITSVAICKFSAEAVEIMLRKSFDKAERERMIEMRAREAERERIEQTLMQEIRSTLSSAAAGTARKNPEFTTNRQVLTLCFMLKHLGVKNVDKTEQARFIEFLTGKTYKDIYDGVREAEEMIYNRNGKDAEYIKDWFQRLELPEIVKEVDTALDIIKVKGEKL